MDKARIQTDKKLQKMEKKVNKIYKDAYGDISKDWIKFMDSHAPKLQKAYDALQEALKSGDKTAIDEAKEVYQRTAMNITVNNKRFQGMAEDTAAKISHTNEVALAYVNDQVPSIYTMNYNQFKNEKIKGYSFSLVNEQAVKNLATSDKTLLPTKKLDIPKDMRWNAKNINSQMVQGILQGESVPKLAKRLGTVTDMNRVSAIRNARTITTAAENKGRQDSFKKAQDDGVIMEREWVAASDERTRAWHKDLDGVRVGVNEPWENDYGEIMYPADPTAHPANVYNCRCSIRARIKGFVWNQTAQIETDFNDDATSVLLRDEIKNKILTGSNFESAPDDVRNAIANSVGKITDERLLTEVSKGLDNLYLDWHSESGTSCHRFGTQSIKMYGDKYGDNRSMDDVVHTFWHEFGHYMDDSASGSSFGYSIPVSDGNYFIHGITSYVDNNYAYANAAIKDVNAFLDRYGLSDRFELKRRDEWSPQWLFYKGTDNAYDMATAGVNDVGDLHDALKRWMDEQSGRKEASEFLLKHGYPKDINYSDYMEVYYTPKTHKRKEREKFKGAENKFYEDSAKVSEAQAAFRERPDWDELVATQSKMYDEVSQKESVLGWVTDTFDGSAYGAFTSVIMGGHDPQYYMMNSNGIREGVANVFMSEMTQDETVINAMKDLCPNVYELIRGGFVND